MQHKAHGGSTKGFISFDPHAVHRAGENRSYARVLYPLLKEGTSAIARRISAQARRPQRVPPVTEVPNFGAPVHTPGMSPGTLINVAPLKVLGARGEPNPAVSYRFEYVTGDSVGRVITATGGVCLSAHPWINPDQPRPVIAFAPSTQGVAAHCDPSHTCAIGLNVFYEKPFDVIAAYELPVLLWFLSHGVDVVFIDYPRDPVAGVQYYCDSISAAQALFDAVRAARSIGIAPDAPVGIWGFSQGGGASGWAAQMTDYAPELNIVAAVVGAPPSDLLEVLAHVDGGLLTGVIAYAVAGLMARSSELQEEILPVINAAGLNHVLSNVTTCAGGTLLGSGYSDTSRWTNSGKALDQVLDDLPSVLKEFERQRLGGVTPTIPVLLWGAKNDDVIPIQPIRKVRDLWSAGGADLHYFESHAPKIPGRTGINHFGPYFRHLSHYSGWLLDHLEQAPSAVR